MDRGELIKLAERVLRVFDPPAYSVMRAVLDRQLKAAATLRAMGEEG